MSVLRFSPPLCFVWRPNKKTTFCGSNEAKISLVLVLSFRNTTNNSLSKTTEEDEEEKINEISENIVKQLSTLIDKKIDLFSSKVNQDLNGI